VLVRDPCATCQGAGLARERRRLTVRIPPGVESGMNLRLRGEGDAGPRGAPSGDLYATIRVREHATFTRERENLHVVVPLTFSQAALGDTLDVPLLGGGRETLAIPAGTQAGEVFTIRGRGLPTLGRPARGDLLVHAKVYTPTKLSSEQRKLLEALAELDGTERRKGFFERFRL